MGEMRKYRLRLAALAGWVVVTGCASGTVGRAAGPSPSVAQSGGVPATAAAPHRGYVPVYATESCDGERFASRLPAVKDHIVCGRFTVPENRAEPDGRQVVLPVAVLKATAADPKPDPVVFIAGGPGDASVEVLANFATSGFLSDHDIVFFDQRGTGRASPSLDCPEVDRVLFANSEHTDDLDQENAALAAAYAKCHDRLVGIADLDQYSTPAMADDIEDLRVAMGAPAWNLYGISYGTEPALAASATHPAGVRSVLLDSVVAPYATESPFAGKADGVLTNIIAGCAAAAACAAAHPHLRDDALAVRTRLNAAPHMVRYPDPAGVVHVANLTGDDVLRGALQAQYDTKLIPLLPQFIGALAGGSDALLDAVGPTLLGSTGSGSEGANLTVLCADRQEVDVALDPERRKDFPLSTPLYVGLQIPEACSTWKVRAIDGRFHAVAPASVPVLVFGGEYDPATPSANSAEVARRLRARATFVGFPGLGHVATGSDAPCPHDIYAAFLADPAVAPNTTCVAAMPKVVFG